MVPDVGHALLTTHAEAQAQHRVTSTATLALPDREALLVETTFAETGMTIVPALAHRPHVAIAAEAETGVGIGTTVAEEAGQDLRTDEATDTAVPPRDEKPKTICPSPVDSPVTFPMFRYSFCNPRTSTGTTQLAIHKRTKSLG